MYISLFRLGAGSHEIAAGASNGAAVLHAYVQHTFGSLGSGFLAVLIALACLVTAVGLTCACAEYFSQVLPLSYRMLVVLLAGFSLVVSNLGLTKLIAFSIPVLTAIYPPCIVLVALSFCGNLWNSQRLKARLRLKVKALKFACKRGEWRRRGVKGLTILRFPMKIHLAR